MGHLHFTIRYILLVIQCFMMARIVLYHNVPL